MFFVYILQSERTGRLYKGSTGDLTKRVDEHNQGLSSSTRSGRPWKLAYWEEYPTRAEAVRRERYLKSGKGRDELAEILRKQIKSR